MGLEIILTLQLNPHSQAPKIKICQNSKVFSIRIAVGNLHKLLIIFIKRSVVNSRTCQKTVNRQNVGLNLIHEYWRRCPSMHIARCQFSVNTSFTMTSTGCQQQCVNYLISILQRHASHFYESSPAVDIQRFTHALNHTWRGAWRSEVHRTHVSS